MGQVDATGEPPSDEPELQPHYEGGAARPGRLQRVEPFPESAFAVIREADDAVFAGGLLAAWPSRVGPSPSIKSGYEPAEGARLLAGHQGVLWRPQQTVLEYAQPLADGTFERGYFEFVKHPDDDSVLQGSGQYQYDLCIDGGLQNNVHLVCEAIGSKPTVPPSVAMFLGGARGMWHPAPRPTARPQVLGYLWDGDCAHFYRNGQHAGSFMGSARTFNAMGAREGNNRPEGQLAGYRGAYYSMRYALGVVPTPAQIEALHAERMERYGISPQEWDPAAVTPTIHLDSRGKSRYDRSPWFGGPGMGNWLNQADLDLAVLGSDAGAQSPSEGRRINGLPTVSFGPRRSMFFQRDAARYLNPATYEVLAVLRVDAIASTQAAAPTQRDALLAEISSGAFSVHTVMLDGRPHIGVSHDDGVGPMRWKTANVPITIGEPGLLHVQYTDGTLSVRWNDGPPATIAAGPIAGSLDGLLGLGRGYGMAPPFQGDLGTLIVREMLPTRADQSFERAWLANDYGLRV